MNHPSSLIHRCFFCVGSILCLLGLVHCVSPSRPCDSGNKCVDPQKPHCVGGECKECDNNDHCTSKNCRSDKTCTPVESTETVVSLDGSEQGVSESSQPDESVSPDVAAESSPEAQIEAAPEPQIESIPEAICVGGATRPCYPAGKIGCIVVADGKYACKGICATGTESCANGVWSGQCTGAIEPTAELCNGKDDDCDGQIDNRCGFFWTTSAGGTVFAGGNSIVVDSLGNLYITGYYHGTASFGTTTLNADGISDIFVTKLNNQGAFQWAVSAGGTQYDSGDSIVVDSLGNLYITGYYQGTAIFGTTTLTAKGSQNIFVAKLNNQGAFQWAVSAGGSAFDDGNSIVVDSIGNLYITGYYGGTATFGKTTLTSKGSKDIFVAKLNDQGVFQWVVSVGGTSYNSGRSIAIDSAENLYITGYYQGTAIFGTTTLTSKGDYDIFVAKLNNQGVFQWAVSAGGTDSDYGNSIAVDSAGNLYIIGYYRGIASYGTTTLTSQGKGDIFVAKLNNQRAFQWAVSAKGGGKDNHYGGSIAVDGTGNIYITGHYLGTASFGTTTLSSKGDSDIFVAKLDNQGAFQWAVSAGRTYSDYGYSIAVDSIGDLYITGEFNGIFITKLR